MERRGVGDVMKQRRRLPGETPPFVFGLSGVRGIGGMRVRLEA